MRLACNLITFEFSGLSTIQSLEHLHEIGIKYVDMTSYGIQQAANLPVAKQYEIARRLQQLDMELVTVIDLPTANPGSNDPMERDAAIYELKKAARFLQRLGGKMIMFCEAGGRPDYHKDINPYEARENSKETMKRFGEWCEKEGINILLEFVPVGGNLSTVEDVQEYIQAVQVPNLYVNIDMGHFCLQGINPKRIYKLGDRVINCHASDNLAAEQKEQDLILGTGDTDFKAFFDVLFDMDIEGNARKAGLPESYCTIEVVEGIYMPNPDYLVSRCYQYLLANFPFLRDPLVNALTEKE